MPVPGPRTQARPRPGYTNPLHQLPDRINRWHRPPPVAKMGATPGLKFVTLRGNVLGAGQVRRMWRQAINYVPASPPFSWTANAPEPGRPISAPVGGEGISRALRYMTRSLYVQAGTDNTRFAGLHTVIPFRHRSKKVTLGAGLVRSRPTIRSRHTSFGSRVPKINSES